MLKNWILKTGFLFNTYRDIETKQYLKALLQKQTSKNWMCIKILINMFKNNNTVLEQLLTDLW